MTISSPGGFIEGVSWNNLLTVEPHGRNPALADALKRIGLAEESIESSKVPLCMAGCGQIIQNLRKDA